MFDTHEEASKYKSPGDGVVAIVRYDDKNYRLLGWAVTTQGMIPPAWTEYHWSQDLPQGKETPIGSVWSRASEIQKHLR